MEAEQILRGDDVSTVARAGVTRAWWATYGTETLQNTANTYAAKGSAAA